MRRFLILVFAVTILAHVPFAVGLAYALRMVKAPWPNAIAVGIASLLVVLLGGRLQRVRKDRPLALWRVVFVEETYFVHWCATVTGFPVSVVALSVIGIYARVRGAVPSAAQLGVAALVCYAGALFVSLYGVWIRRRWVHVRTLDVPIPHLGRAFDGYRIAQLSDLHIGSLWPRERAQRWLPRVNDLDVDLIALTGDYVTSGSAFHSDVAFIVRGMQCRDGTVAVLGNHDYFGDVEGLVAKLRLNGVDVLRNERRVLVRGKDQVVLAGVDDTWSQSADVEKALCGHDVSAPLIALAHDPKLFPELAAGGASLVLAGHTHWGQVAVPFHALRYNLSRLSYRYHAGLYRIGPATLHVSAGLGTTGPPVRLGAAPEITVLRLRRA